MKQIHSTFFLALIILLLGSAPASAFTRAPVTAENGMVVTSQHLASEVGAEIMKAGGNAVDAALAVTNPCCGNIGGGGFATLHLADGSDVFVNFREKAPGAATETMFLDVKGEVVPDLSLKGYLAVAVPGTVLGLDTLLLNYGTLPPCQRYFFATRINPRVLFSLSLSVVFMAANSSSALTHTGGYL